MNNITKTIKESLESFEEKFNTVDKYGIIFSKKGTMFFPKEDGTQLDTVKSHLLPSQIKVIEAVIEGMKRAGNPYIFSMNDEASLVASGYGKALKDQISSLNEVLKELKTN